ncbi:MAG: CPBP family intramembrane metalloprotease [Leptolyngbya sp. SIOISBB]|nr:CPBP family intramembrane metalloprotease [Leptolyngbya sp. SIOISBB]
MAYLVGIIILAAPIVLPLYHWEYVTTDGQSVIWAPVTLFLTFVICLPLWMRRIHPNCVPWKALGFQRPRRWWRSWGYAFIAGVIGIVLLYGLQLLLGWGNWQIPVQNTGRFLLEGSLVGVGVGLAEELLFRGWLLYELEQDCTAAIALWINAVIFAIAHFIRPLSAILATWPQFVGLMLLGAALVWARRIPHTANRGQPNITTLGAAAGLHGGLVFAYYQVDVNDLVVATGQVPEWVTGIDGNPLAGLLGLAFLSVICCVTYRASHP